MAKMKNIFTLLAALTLTAGSMTTAGAGGISDYTSFPPFLPRVVSPNILFLLDYSKNMVRPAYGTCDSNLGDCRTNFAVPIDNYSSTRPYEGYYDNGHDDKVPTYTDARASMYNCTSGGSPTCSKGTASDPGEWNGNWLNWLTMSQFDIVKKVVMGGDIDPAPEGSHPTNMKLRSILTTGVNITKAVDLDTCTGNSPQCTKWPAISYDSDLFNNGGSTTISKDLNKFPSDADSMSYNRLYKTSSLDPGDEGIVKVQLPFTFNFYGNNYTDLFVHSDGIAGFTFSALAQNLYSSVASTVIPKADDLDNIIAPYFHDLDLGSGKIWVKTFGTSPNRIFAVTFEDVYHYPSSFYTGGLTFQILFYEGSNHIVFQYKDLTLGSSTQTGTGTIVGVENADGSDGKSYSAKSETGLSEGLAVFASDHMAYKITPVATSRGTGFQVMAPLPGSADVYAVNIALSSGTAIPANSECPLGTYPNGDQGKCYDHKTTGLFHDFRDDESEGVSGFRMGFMRVGVQNSETDGGEIKTKGKYFNSRETSSLFTSTRGQTPSGEAPLAEALYEARRYIAQDDPYWTNDYVNTDGDAATDSCSPPSGSNTDPYCFKSAEQKVPCAKTYVLLVSSGNYTDDAGWNIFTDTEDSSDGALPSDAYTLVGSETGSSDAGTKANGGWLDNVAYKAKLTDLRSDMEGTQNITLYAVNTYGEGTGDGTDVLKRAAQYGGYKTDPADEDPDDPRTYFDASGGGTLKDQILSAVRDIIKNSASGTSVSVLSTSAEGTGALYQAYFYPARIEGQSEERRWPGFLRAFFLDRKQNLRDDFSNTSASGTSNSDSRLVMAEDRVVHMELDQASNEVKVKLLRDDDGIFTIPVPQSSYEDIVSMDNVPSIWEGGEKLAERTKSDRKIYLWVDLDNEGDVDDSDWATNSGEARSLGDWPAADLVPYLRAADTLYNSPTPVKTATTEAAEIIDFVKGNHVGGYRNRCIDVGAATAETGCTGGQRVWPLGDIIYSTPTLVGAPGEKFDLIYGDTDTGYKAFTNEYKNRRQVVYTGANDGMLHAFNAGVYHTGDDTSGTAPAGKVESGWFDVNPDSTSFSSAAIGDERWAFIPHDNLPHLAWLACNGTKYDPDDPSAPFDPAVCGDAEYTHVYYVDHRPKVTDARIFYDSTYTTGNVVGQTGTGASHPNGWGTILILPLRMGGGAMDVNADFNNNGNTTDPDDTRQFRSAYYAFDITNPELPPKLLWRFTHAELGFSVSYPGIVRVNGEWLMVIGSGPVNSTGARDYGSKSPSGAAQAGKLFVVNLATGSLAGSGPLPLWSNTDAIMGDPTVVDADLDFSADVIYIGSAVGATSGRIHRININGNSNPDLWDPSILFDPDPSQSSYDPDDVTGSNIPKDMGPLLVPPSISKDIFGNLWVFFGTGRLRNSDDLQNSDQQRFYGIKDGCWKGLGESTCPAGSTYAIGDLFNANAVTVSTDTGSVDQVHDYTSGSTVCGTGVNAATDGCSYTTMLQQVRSKKGWYFDLADTAGDIPPSERVLSRGSVLGGLVLFTTYKPQQDMCSILGQSNIYAVYYETGTAYNKKVLPQSDSDTEVAKSYDLGAGMPTSVGVAVGDTVSGFVQKSTGEIVRIETAPGLGVRSGVAAWRENSGGGTVEIESIYKHIVK